VAVQEVSVKTNTWAVLVLLLLLPARSQEPPAPQRRTQEDDYKVYSLVLQANYVRKGVERLVIGDHTLMALPPVMMGMTQPGDTPEMKKIRKTATKETTQDYEEKNKSPAPLENRFSVKVPIVLMSEGDRDRVFQVKGEGEKKTGNPKGFDEFYRLYPKSTGFMSVSRIGYNSAKTQALLYIGNLCGGLCGTGQVFLLVKDDGAWKVQYVAMTWIS
jgi:hypothetical protein